MPRSKRATIKKNKKGFGLKEKLTETVRSCAEKYDRCFIFAVHNMRNIHLKDLREKWRSDSRFLMGKKTVIKVAVGKGPEDEPMDGLHLVGKHLAGEAGLLFTMKKKAEVLKFFKGYKVADFARSGDVATETVVLEAGPLKVDHCHSMEPQLRQWGLPTSLVKGVITLTQEHTVCKKGEKLNPEKCRILKLFGYQMADFTFRVTGVWSKDSGKWETLTASRKGKSETMETDEREDEEDEEEEEEEDDDADIADT
ncbi:hypothetical protein ACOMHN_052109 [Nucella lapillus]